MTWPANLNAERQRLERQRRGEENWRLWGPYLAERAWGTVREGLPEFHEATIDAREALEHEPAVYWWWWPERLWPGVEPKPFTLEDYIREYGEDG